MGSSCLWRELDIPPAEFFERGVRRGHQQVSGSLRGRRMSMAPGRQRMRYGRVLRELPSGDYTEEGNAMIGMAVAMACSMPIWSIVFFVLFAFFR